VDPVVFSVFIVRMCFYSFVLSFLFLINYLLGRKPLRFSLKKSNLCMRLNGEGTKKEICNELIDRQSEKREMTN